MAQSQFRLPQLSDLPAASAAAVPPLLTAVPHIQRLIKANPICTSLTVSLSLSDNSDHTPISSNALVPNQAPTVVERRKLLFHALSAAAFCLTPIPLALADNDDFRFYSDEVNKFKISIPQDWEVGNGEGGGIKALIAFYPQESANSNVTIVITGLGADFTRLESFGKVDAFAENLVGGLDRSWQKPPGVAAKLVDSKAANGLYYIEYTLQNPGESRRHLYSVLGVANNGWYNRLYTLTGQFIDEEAEKYGSTIEKVTPEPRGVARGSKQFKILRGDKDKPQLRRGMIIQGSDRCVVLDNYQERDVGLLRTLRQRRGFSAFKRAMYNFNPQHLGYTSEVIM